MSAWLGDGSIDEEMITAIIVGKDSDIFGRKQTLWMV